MKTFSVILLVAALSACSSTQPSITNRENVHEVTKSQGREIANDALPHPLDPDTQDSRCGRSPRTPAGRLGNGILDTAKRAKKIGQTYLIAIYSDRLVRQPLEAHLQDGIWSISGANLPPGHLGGNVHIQICQSSGAVLGYFGTQ